jgi:hypothetical protein
LPDWIADIPFTEEGLADMTAQAIQMNRQERKENTVRLGHEATLRRRMNQTHFMATMAASLSPLVRERPKSEPGRSRGVGGILGQRKKSGTQKSAGSLHL